MPSRHVDWMKQAKHDLQHARHALEDEDFEWSCFAAQQSAEKAIKALYQSLGGEARGHSVKGLLERLPEKLQPGRKLKLSGAELDKYYIPTRYPDSYSEGAPFEYYNKEEAERVIEHAEQIIRFCESHLA